MATTGRLRKRIVGALRGTEGSDVPSSITMTIKSAPPRTAKMMTRMSVRHGYMNKRNEQAVWQRRYCVLVPHTFLYYFESEDAECPRGVIDLEYYADISADDRHIVKGGGLTRTFYFLPDGDVDTADWLAALNRERYFQVREERDEYRDLQNEFSSQIRANVDAVSAAFEEKEALQADLSQERTSSIAHQGQMKKLLLKLGLASQEAEAVMAADEHDHSLQALHVIEKVFEEHEHKWKEAQKQKQQWREEAQARQEAELQQWHERLVALETRGEEERRALQAQIQEEKDKRHVVECELHGVRDQLQLLEAQSTQSIMNVSVALAQQRALEAKLHEVGEHKKLLVKEVKSLRANLDKSRNINRQLVAACRAMETEHRSLRARIQQENGPHEGGQKGEEGPEGEGGEDCPSLAALQLREALEEAQCADYSSPSSSLVSEECPPGLPKPLPPSGPLLATTASLLHVTTRSLTETFELLPSPPRRPLLSLGPGESPSTLHGTGEPSPRPLGEGRSPPHPLSTSSSSSPARSVEESLPSSVASAQMLRGLGAKLRVLLHEVDNIDTFLFPNPPPPHLPQAHPPPQPPAPSTPLADPTAHSFPCPTPKTGSRGVCPPEVEVTVDGTLAPLASSSSESDTGGPHPSSEEPPPVQVQMCRRCNGSVEGPLLSTCRCLEPLLSPAAPLLPSASNFLSMLKAVRAPSIGDAYQSLSSLPSSSTLLRRLGQHKDGGRSEQQADRAGGEEGEKQEEEEEGEAAIEASKGPTADQSPSASQGTARHKGER